MKSFLNVALGVAVLPLASILLLGCRTSTVAEGSDGGRAANSTSARVLYYVDPMHPSYRSAKPGIAPDCGMRLVPVYADQGGSVAAEPSPNSVQVDPSRQQMIGLTTASVTRGHAQVSGQILGRVEVDDTLVSRVMSGGDGWVHRTFDHSVGSRVRKNETLAEFYSPEFIALEQGYLVASDRMSGQTKQQATAGTVSAAARLRNLGMADPQIEEISRTHQLPDYIHILSPRDGYIVARNISDGTRFGKDTELYQVADLSRVWILATVPEEQVAALRPGMSVAIEVPGRGRRLAARVTDAVPVADAASRTVNIRLEAGNPSGVLHPGMLVDIHMAGQSSGALTVPLDAVIDTGAEQHVLVASGSDRFTPRTIRTGAQIGDHVEVLSGLSEGEHVVASAAFLVDSEARIEHSANPTPALRSGDHD